MQGTDDDSPGVAIPPPLLFVGGFLVGLLTDGVVPIPLLGSGARGTAVPLGWGAVALGLGSMLWGLFTFARSRTAVMPHMPATRLVQAGPYRFTRNPMYLGLALAYAGLSLLIDTAWPLLLLPVVLALLVVIVIRREERYLERRFGDEYRDYRRRVGRWL